jgi:hypothetical protein
MAKVIHINAKEKKVEVKEAKTLEEMQALVGGYIERVAYIKGLGASSLTVDEEGLMKGYDHGFTMDGHQFMGNGFIGTLGKSDVKVTVEQVTPRIVFYPR